MPKLRVPPEQKMDKFLTGAIVRWQGMTGSDYKQTSALLGFSKDTYYRRMDSPENFTLKDLRAMVRKKIVTINDLEIILGVVNIKS